MKSWTLSLALGAALVATAVNADDAVQASASTETTGEATSEVGSEAVAELDDLANDAEPAVDLADATIDSIVAVDAEELPASDVAFVDPVEAEVGIDAAEDVASLSESFDAVIESGTVGVDAAGQSGRIHVVVTGDTLWDIAASYLDTPWVWPAIWRQNEEIANPHRIYPGNHLWISDTEMRVVTPAEAAVLVASKVEPAPAAPAAEPVLAFEEMPAAMEAPQETISLVPTEPSKAIMRSLEIPARGNMSFVSAEMLEAASSIVESASPRTWLLEGDPVVIGLGEGETEVGARYDVFDDADPVRDEETGQLHGYHVRVNGWIEVQKVHGDTATGVIRSSVSEMMRGQSIVARESMPIEVGLVEAPEDLRAKIIYTPSFRRQMTMLDYVYLNRGSIHGVEEGAMVEVFESGDIALDVPRRQHVLTPDRNIADLVVVKVKAETSVAFILHSKRELEVGDPVRRHHREPETVASK